MTIEAGMQQLCFHASMKMLCLLLLQAADSASFRICIFHALHEMNIRL